MARPKKTEVNNSSAANEKEGVLLESVEEKSVEQTENVGNKIIESETFPVEKTEDAKDGVCKQIDWKLKIPTEHITLNREFWSKKNVNIYSLSEEEREDLKKRSPEQGLLIKLSGFREVARARGIEKIDSELVYFSPKHVAVKCTILFQPSNENPLGLSVSAIANASTENTNGDFSKFLETIAENRAFLRAVKNALNIYILGQDELPVEVNEIVIDQEATPSLHNMYKEMLSDMGYTFTHVKNTLMKKQDEYPGCENWEKIEDIPQSVILVLIQKAKNKKNKESDS